MIAAKEDLNVEVCAMFKYYIQIFKKNKYYQFKGFVYSISCFF